MARQRRLRQSAGVLLYRHINGGPPGGDQLEMLLVHPSGTYNRRAPWSIPKGLIDAGETAEAAARRELLEDTGLSAGHLRSLGAVSYQKSPKQIHAFAAEASSDAVPVIGSWEVDQVKFFPSAAARELIHPDQRPLIERLCAELGL